MKVLICCKEPSQSCDLLEHKVKQALKEEKITADVLDVKSVKDGTIMGNQYDITFADKEYEHEFDEEMGIDLVAVEAPYGISELRKALRERYR